MSTTEAVQASQEQSAEEALLARIQAGELIEDMDELTPRYKAILERTLEIAAQSEVTVLTWAYTAFDVAPDTGAPRPRRARSWPRPPAGYALRAFRC